jgi:hypothetical protein
MSRDEQEVQAQQVEGKGVALSRVADLAWLLSYEEPPFQLDRIETKTCSGTEKERFSLQKGQKALITFLFKSWDSPGRPDKCAEQVHYTMNASATCSMILSLWRVIYSIKCLSSRHYSAPNPTKSTI